VPEVEVAFGHTVLEGAKMQVNSSTIAFYETQLIRRLIAFGIKQDCLAHVELCRLPLTSTHPT